MTLKSTLEARNRRQLEVLALALTLTLIWLTERIQVHAVSIDAEVTHRPTQQHIVNQCRNDKSTDNAAYRHVAGCVAEHVVWTRCNYASFPHRRQFICC